MPGATDGTLDAFLWRAERLYPDREIVSNAPDGGERYGYADYADRTARLANALDGLVAPGDRVGTVCWNHHRHFEAYFGVPSMGAQLHTINPLLPDGDLAAIVDEAGDRVLLVDPSLVGTVVDAAGADAGAFDAVERFVVTGPVPDGAAELPGPVAGYEALLADEPATYDWPDLAGDRPAGLCYTSGTTGRPKGVEYTHAMLWAHTMAVQSPQGTPHRDGDVLMPVVPMFHVNAWGLPYAATAAGAKQVLPGPSPGAADLARLIAEEGVTLSAGVPTVWLDLMEYADDEPVDLGSLERVIVGGSAAPSAMVEWFDARGVEVLHAWGMTETSPLGLVNHPKVGAGDGDDRDRAGKQGLPVPGLEIRVVDADTGEELPWDGEAVGELQVRGPWVASEYVGDAGGDAFDDGWLRTGDVVAVDPAGYVEIVDRLADVIKSGGEWISSLRVENGIVALDAVAEAAVVGVPHERWRERPVAVVALAAGADEEGLRDAIEDRLTDRFPRWWLPDEVVVVEDLPKTATGKFDKVALRRAHADPELVEGRVPEDEAPDRTG